MDWWLLTFFIGAILSLFSPIVPELTSIFITLLICSSLCYYRPFRINSGIVFGALWMLLHALNSQNTWQSNQLSVQELVESNHFIKGTITSLQQTQLLTSLKTQPLSSLKNDNTVNVSTRAKFIIHVNVIGNKRLPSPVLMRLSWAKPTFQIMQGQKLNLKVKLKPAHGLSNVGGFNYRTWLKSKDILATGYVVNNKENKPIKQNISLRQKYYTSFVQQLPNHELSPLILALTFGDRSHFTPQLWRVLQATGTGHLIAISGLHIGLVASAVYLLLMFMVKIFPTSLFDRIMSGRLVGTQSHNAFQCVNFRYIIITISLLFAMMYGYLAGFSLPTIRALIMLSIYWLSRCIAIKIPLGRWLLLTLFIITITSPFSLFTASFWLSFYAVTIIFLTLWRFKTTLRSGSDFWRFIKGLLIIQLVITVMLLPLSALFFGQLSTTSLFANLIAVPWMSFVTIPLCLLSLLSIPFGETVSNNLIFLSLESLNLLWYWLVYLSDFSFANISLSQINKFFIILVGGLFFIGLFILAFSFKDILSKTNQLNKYFAVGIFTLFCLLLLCIKPISNLFISESSSVNKSARGGEWQVHIMDVGQGLAVLILKNQKAILYDTGAAYPSGFNMVDAVIMPFLKSRGIELIDKVLISHSDNDHAGGLLNLVNKIPVKHLIINHVRSDEILTTFQDNTHNEKSLRGLCTQGNSFEWQGLSFNMLWPKTLAGKQNDDSCVVHISDGQQSILLTGDISKKIEQQLTSLYPNLKTDVLVVPHHGSNTSSSESFIKQLNPQLAIVSSGFYNRWKMPAKKVVNQYQKANVTLLNTAVTGQIMLTFEGRKEPSRSFSNSIGKLVETSSKTTLPKIQVKRPINTENTFLQSGSQVPLEPLNGQVIPEIKVSTFKDDLWPFWFSR